MLWPWMLAVAVAIIVGSAVWFARRRARGRVEVAWKDSMRRLTEYCQQFAVKHGLSCMSGVEEWPYGWPRLHGNIEGAAFSLAFGWQNKDVWVASMRVRAAGRIAGDFHVVRSYAEGTRTQLISTGDREFDEAYHVTSNTGVYAARQVLTSDARHALLAITDAELGYRDGVAVLSWPCETFLRGGTDAENEYTTIEFGYDVVAELARASRAEQGVR